MKYLKKFENAAALQSWQKSANHVNPNVVLIGTSEIQYDVPALLGVFIQHIDGSLYTTDKWTAGGFANDQAQGVAVLAENAEFVIAKANISGTNRWSSYADGDSSGVFTTKEETVARTDFAGKANTEAMLSLDTSGAGYSCANYTFPNGAKGYLPSFGEMAVAYTYKSAINSALALIGGTALSNQNYWTSTQYTPAWAWYFTWTNGTSKGYYKGNACYVRAFTML